MKWATVRIILLLASFLVLNSGLAHSGVYGLLPFLYLLYIGSLVWITWRSDDKRMLADLDKYRGNV